MGNRRVSLDEAQEFFLDLEHGKGEALEKRSRWLRGGRAERVLAAAMKWDLTQRQRECVELYFFHRLTMNEIAQQLEVEPSTVCRHLKKAKLRLKRAFAYAEALWNLEKEEAAAIDAEEEA